MPGAAEEATFADTPLASDLAAGLESLDLNQVITFTQYVRLVLPLDGYVFFVNAAIVGPSALPNSALPNRVGPNQAASVLKIASTFDCQGSLHFSTDIRQEAAETYAANRVVFTAEQSVNNLNDIAPGTLWIGQIQGQIGSKRFAFSSQSSRYKQAGLWHYVGFAVYPDMEPQIIDSPASFDSTNVIVSNSLPAWLYLNGYVPGYGFGNPSLKLYPSFLVPENLEPPFGAVDIPPERTIALAGAPHISSKTSTHSQLCSDTVKITLWGTRNFNALDFVDCVYQWSSDFGVIGIMNMPVVQDEKRTQSELATIAMKKSVTFEISYHQRRINDIAQQIIRSAIPSFYIDGKPA